MNTMSFRTRKGEKSSRLAVSNDRLEDFSSQARRNDMPKQRPITYTYTTTPLFLFR